jgi:hypothetical protein
VAVEEPVLDVKQSWELGAKKAAPTMDGERVHRVVDLKFVHELFNQHELEPS